MFKKKNGENLFEIKPISLKDCIEDSKFLPFSLIEKKSNNAYENMMAEMGGNNPNDTTYKESVETYIKRYVYMGEEHIPDELIELMGDEEKQILFGAIIKKSFKFFDKVLKIPKNTAINLHFLAKDYGKTPIEIILNDNDYNLLDAYIFNNYCLYCGKEIEDIQNKAANKGSGK